MTTAATTTDRRAQRRAARREENKADILDAAEAVFGAEGPAAGSLRQIADASGFSTAAIYLFFDNKQDLLSQTLLRRGVELAALLREQADGPDAPREKLHGIAEATIGFFTAHPDFRLLLSHLRSGAGLNGPVLDAYASADAKPFRDAMGTITGLIEAGQAAGDIRPGAPAALAHFFSVMVNEHLFLASTPGQGAQLTAHQLRDMTDAMLRPS